MKVITKENKSIDAKTTDSTFSYSKNASSKRHLNATVSILSTLNLAGTSLIVNDRKSYVQSNIVMPAVVPMKSLWYKNIVVEKEVPFQVTIIGSFPQLKKFELKSCLISKQINFY